MSLNERAAEILAEQLAAPNEPTDAHLASAKAQVDAWRRQNPVTVAMLAALDERVPAQQPQQRQAAPKAPKQAPQEPVVADEQAGK